MQRVAYQQRDGLNVQRDRALQQHQRREGGPERPASSVLGPWSACSAAERAGLAGGSTSQSITTPTTTA